MRSTLEVLRAGEPVFVSTGRWLHPLLDLARRLEEGDLVPAELTVRDRVVGRAAALILVHLGVGRVEAEVLSTPGRRALERFGVPWSCRAEVDRIDCRTEELLLLEDDPAAAFELVRRRAGRGPGAG